MTKEKIIAGNKLISEFMCFKISKDEISSHTAIKENNKVIGFKSMDFYGKINNGGRQGSWNSFDEMEFYTSWDWLMPVIERIENSCNRSYQFKIYRNQAFVECTVMNDKTILTSQKFVAGSDYKGENTKLANTYQAVIEFIEWYNKQK